MVTWRDAIGPGERLDPPGSAGKSWVDRSQAPFARSPLLGAAPIALERQATWRASKVRPGPNCAIGRTAEIRTEIGLAFGEVGASTCFMARHRYSGRCRPHGNRPERLEPAVMLAMRPHPGEQRPGRDK